jgi:hypothetical protein
MTAAVSVLGAAVVLAVRPRRLAPESGKPRSRPQRAASWLS